MHIHNTSDDEITENMKAFTLKSSGNIPINTNGITTTAAPIAVPNPTLPPTVFSTYPSTTYTSTTPPFGSPVNNTSPFTRTGSNCNINLSSFSLSRSNSNSNIRKRDMEENERNQQESLSACGCMLCTRGSPVILLVDSPSWYVRFAVFPPPYPLSPSQNAVLLFTYSFIFFSGYL